MSETPPEDIPPLEPPVIWPEPGARAPEGQALNRVLEPDDLHTEPMAGHNRGIAALIAEEKARAGEQLSFVYPSKVWEYPWALARHPLPEGEIVLDAGCGVSTLPIYLATRGATVVALDVDVRWLTMLRSAARFHDAPVVPVLGDMAGLGFPDETFDRVYCISVLEHLPVAQQPDAMREMARVLRPGGILYLTVDYDEVERRSESDVVYDRRAVQRHAVAPSGLVIEGATRWGVDDWARQRARMREFKLHTFGAMGVVLRKPPADGPESAAAIATRVARIEGVSSLPRRPIGDGADGPWIAALGDAPLDAIAEAAPTAVEVGPTVTAERVAAIHAAAPDVAVIAFADADAVTDGALDGRGLDLYGVRAVDPPPAEEVSLVRPLVVDGASSETASARGYGAAVGRAVQRSIQ